MALCGGVFAFAGVSMGQRVRAYYEAVPPPRHVFRQILQREFAAFGHPLKLSDAQTPDGAPALRIEYAGQRSLLPVDAPVAPGVEDLGAYTERLALLAFAPTERGRLPADLSDAEQARLVLVSRRAAPGRDDDMAALVGLRLSTFDVIEFKPDGTLDGRRMQIQVRDRQTGGWKLPAREADPATDVIAIEPRSWEFQAALFALPKSHNSYFRFEQDAVRGSGGVPGMGWTLPTAAFSALGVMVGLMVTLAARTHRR